MDSQHCIGGELGVFKHFLNSHNTLSLIVARLLLVMSATNAACERAFLARKRIETYLRNSASMNHLNYCMVFHVYAADVGKMNTTEIVREFIQYVQTHIRQILSI